MESNAETDKTLWKELRARVYLKLEEKALNRYADNTIYLKTLILILTIFICYAAINLYTPSILWLGAWATIGVATFFLIVNASHDASHGTLFVNSSANKYFLLGSFGLLGIDGELWSLRHKTAHHPHTNVSGLDSDSIANPFLRLSPLHPWRPWFRFQHYYAVILYAFAFAHTAFIQDFEHLFLKPLPYLRNIKFQRAAVIRMFAVKVAFLLVFLALPLLASEASLPWICGGIAVQSVSASLVFVLTICLNHYVTETTFYDQELNLPETGHLLHQLYSSADWHATNKFCCMLMGGANAHTAHHLFPGLSHRHYHWISEIIVDFCKEKSLPYNSFTFCEGIQSHFNFLKNLGRSPQAV